MYLLPPVLKKLHTDASGHRSLHEQHHRRRDGGGRGAQRDGSSVSSRMPVEDNRLAITPLHVEQMVAIFPATTRDIPKEVTPEYVATQFWCSRSAPSATLIRRWLSADRTLAPQASMLVSEIEAVKIVVAAGMGMSIVPAMSVAPPERRHRDPAARSAADPDAGADPSSQQAGRSRASGSCATRSWNWRISRRRKEGEAEPVR